MTPHGDEPALADVQQQYPAWRCWRAVSGLYHARRTTTRPQDEPLVTGEDPRDLRDQIRRAEAATGQ